MAAVYGQAERADRNAILYPFPEEGEDWKWEPRGVLTVEKDAALAATNAIADVWPGVTIREGMCHTHANLRWFSKHKGLLKNLENEKKMSEDLHYGLREAPHVAIVPVLRKLMLKKWTTQYREPVVAAKWSASWGDSIITRVEMNAVEVSPLRGGIPCDNNAVESGNYTDKTALNYNRPSIVHFVPTLVGVLNSKSKTDLVYNGKMKKRQKTKFSGIHHRDFYQRCWDINARHEHDKPTFLSLQFCFTSAAHDIPVGSVIVAGDRCIGDLGTMDDVDVDSIRECKEFLRRNKWVKVFKAFLKNPELVTEDQDWSFDELNDWCKTFHVLRPLVADGGHVEQAITHLHAMLSYNNIPMMPLEDLLELREDEGLVSCTCKKYLHYCMCPHSFLTALRRGIIKGYPPTLDPTPVNSNARGAGRPRKAHPGGALARDD